MTTAIKKHSALLLLSTLLISSSIFAHEDPMVEKSKNINKTYTLSGNDRVNINNRFGKMKVTPWEKNELKVDIVLKASANSDSRAQEILDKLSVDDAKVGSTVRFETEIDNGRDGNTTKDKERFSIDYEVYMPVKNFLEVYNEFGSTTIGDYSGEISISTKFGALTTGKLTNPKKVSVEFGTAEIAGIINGDIEIKFSRAVIGKIDGSVTGQFEHCSGVKLNVSPSVKSLKLNSNFTTLYLDVAKNTDLNIQVDTHFGDFTNKSSFDIKKEDDDDNDRGPKFDYRYTGKTGSGNTSVRVRAEFSKVITGHDLNMELEKDKKSEKKTRDI